MDKRGEKLLFLQLLCDDIKIIQKAVEGTLLADHIREQRRLNRSLPIEKQRVPWSHFCTQISDKHFRRRIILF